MAEDKKEQRDTKQVIRAGQQENIDRLDPIPRPENPSPRAHVATRDTKLITPVGQAETFHIWPAFRGELSSSPAGTQGTQQLHQSPSEEDPTQHNSPTSRG